MDNADHGPLQIIVILDVSNHGAVILVISVGQALDWRIILRSCEVPQRREALDSLPIIRVPHHISQIHILEELFEAQLLLLYSAWSIGPVPPGLMPFKGWIDRSLQSMGQVPIWQGRDRGIDHQ